MKKFFCLFLAILFICTVIVHGKAERFSIEAMLTNLTNFEDIPTLDDIINIWKQNYYFDEEAYERPIWLEFYAYFWGEPFPYHTLNWDLDNPYIMKFYLPTAYNLDYTIDESVVYQDWHIYDEFGNLIVREGPPIEGTNIPSYYTTAPICYDMRHSFEHYGGTNEVLEFFDNVRAFFSRLGSTVSVIVQMIVSVIDNAQYFLPWNNTVARE